MSYYWFNREKFLKIPRDKYHNKKVKGADKYYIANIIFRKNAKNRYRHLLE